MSSNLSRLHSVVDRVEDWMGHLEPRNEKEIPLLNAARQLLSESCQFATAVADCICRGNMIAAYSNLRPLIERKLHLKAFWEDPNLQGDWEQWGMAKLSNLISGRLSRHDFNPTQIPEARAVLQKLRHWNRDTQSDRQLKRANSYSWGDRLREVYAAMTDEDRDLYNLCSTYLHPTYRGSADPELDAELVSRDAMRSLLEIFVWCAPLTRSCQDSGD